MTTVRIMKRKCGLKKYPVSPEFQGIQGEYKIKGENKGSERHEV